MILILKSVCSRFCLFRMGIEEAMACAKLVNAQHRNLMRRIRRICAQKYPEPFGFG